MVGKVKILDENDQEVPAGQIGTVYFADAPVFAYHNDPEKTKRAYNAKGWSTLGDVGYLDDEGFLYLTDRKSYMIISGGVNIYPQETEDVLITHPDVADVAVFGVPNEEMGEEVKAVVQPHDMASAGKAAGSRADAVLPQASVADQMPAEHRLRGRTAAHADRQAGEAASARQILAEDGGEGVAAVAQRMPMSAHARPCAGHRTILQVSSASRRRGWPRTRLGHDEDQADAMTPRPPFPDIPLPSAIRSRFVEDINGLACTCWKPASRRSGRPCLLAAARLSRTRL